MANRKPVVNVTVGGDTYPAGESLPDGVADLIDNPKVWGEESADEAGESPRPAKKAAAKRSGK